MLHEFLDNAYGFLHKINNYTKYAIKTETEIKITSNFTEICKIIAKNTLKNFIEINLYEREKNSKKNFFYLRRGKYNLYIDDENFSFAEIEEDYKNRIMEEINLKSTKGFFSFLTLQNENLQALSHFYLKQYDLAYKKFENNDYEMQIVSLIYAKKIDGFTDEIRNKLFMQLNYADDEFMIMRIFMLNYFFNEKVKNLLILFSIFMEKEIMHKKELTIFLLLLLLPKLHTDKYKRLYKCYLYKLAVLYYENGEIDRAMKTLSVEEEFREIKFI